MTHNEIIALHFAVNYTLNGIKDQLAVLRQSDQHKTFPQTEKLLSVLTRLQAKLKPLGGPPRAEPGGGAEPGV